MSTGTVRACERSIGGSDAAGGDGDDVPPPPVERAPGGSVLRANTPWGVQHRSTEHRAVGGDASARGTGGGEGDIGDEGGGRRETGSTPRWRGFSHFNVSHSTGRACMHLTF